MAEVRYLDIDCIGEFTAQRYVGTFEVKLFLTLKERAEAGRLRHKLLKDISDNDDVYFLLQLLTNLNVHISGKKPDWWGEDGTDLSDNEPIIAVATALRQAQQIEIDSKKTKS